MISHLCAIFYTSFSCFSQVKRTCTHCEWVQPIYVYTGVKLPQPSVEKDIALRRTVAAGPEGLHQRER